ncbi:MAG TPA: MFS transporter [Ktedonobacteraceae bacterium]|nr:MFS transporter [Ktedonobacteraceae bacterium]
MIAILRQRNFALLWVGGLISNTGDWLLIIGLPVYVYLLTGSALATSITLITAFVPNLLIGSVAGVFVDRWDRRWTMIISNLLLALGLLPMLAVHSKDTLWIVYVVAFFESCCDQFVSPTESALIPNLVSEEHLVPANALKSIGMNSSRLIGGALGGIVLVVLGLRGVVLIDAISFLFVAIMISFIRMPAKMQSTSQLPETSSPETHTANENNKQEKAEHPLRHFVGEWLEGLQLIRQQRALTMLLVMFALQSLGEGVFGVLLVVFVKQVLHGGSVDYGLILSIQAVGSLVGGIFIGTFGNRFAPARMLGVCVVLFGLIDLLIIDIPVFLPSLLLVMALFVVVGIPGTAGMVSFQSLLQFLIEDKLRGRVFGVAISIGALMTLLGMILAGALGDRLGPVLMLNIQGGMYTLPGILVILTLWWLKIGKQAARETGTAVGDEQVVAAE